MLNIILFPLIILKQASNIKIMNIPTYNSIVILIAFITTASSALFKPSQQICAYQVRLSLTPDLSTQLFSFPNQLPNQLSNIGLSLSGYDTPKMSIFSFRVQISYDDSKQSFEIMLSLYNSTSIYFLNYFIIATTQTSNQLYSIHTIYVPPSPDAFTDVGLNRFTSISVQTPFLKTQQNKIVCIPLLRSISSQIVEQYSYFNVSQILFFNGNYNVTVSVFNNFSYLAQAYLTLVVYHQSNGEKEGFMSTAYSNLVYRISDSDNTLQIAGKKSFGIPYQYGPQISPKCLLGFQGYFLQGKKRQIFSFTLGDNSITQISVSNSYTISYAFLCSASIICESEGLQYYPLINSCEPLCNITNCQVCSSSTSCSNCLPSYFINQLARCLRCPDNCNTCSSISVCSKCSLKYYVNSTGICEACKPYCLSCNISTCYNCTDGFLAVGSLCRKCDSIMPFCLSCSAPSFCSQCSTNYVFNSNAKGCISCNDSMPNCLTCNLPNNCQACSLGFYLSSFSICSSCTSRIPSCCAYFVGNCSVCKTNSTCQICKQKYYLNSNQGCSSCAVYGDECENCNSSQCYDCSKGYYLDKNQCFECKAIYRHCITCDQGNCTECEAGRTLVDNQCLNCPIWPLENMYFLDSDKVCQSCKLVTQNCTKCDKDGRCIQCSKLYFLKSLYCHSCQQFMEKCLSCLNQSICSTCLNGYHVNPLDKQKCLPCNGTLPNCGQCSLQVTSFGSSQIICNVCSPEYYLRQKICISCLQKATYCLHCTEMGCSECLLGYYLNQRQQCLDCPSILIGCTNCISSRECSQCKQGYFLSGKICFPCSSSLQSCSKCTPTNQTLTCSQCQAGFVLNAKKSCQPCLRLFSFCTNCTFLTCSSCISGYYISPKGTCDKCSIPIPNCAFCSKQLRCLSCNGGYWLNTQLNACQSCSDYLKGCTECLELPRRKAFNCTVCDSTYALYPTSDLVYNCVPCNLTMPNCIQCSSPAQCLICSLTAFLNSYGTCSLCSLYIMNCYSCSNASFCNQCLLPFIFANGSCLSCELSQFGTSNKQSLCLKCDYQQKLYCSQCIEGYYFNPLSEKCLSCFQLVLNCKLCAINNVCLACLSGFQLSQNNDQCLSCNQPFCQTCSKGVCHKCMEGYFIKSDRNCEKCSILVPGCEICDQSTCKNCTDGYFLNEGRCKSCSLVEVNCILCSSGKKCLLTINQTPKVQPQTPNYKILAIVLMAIFLLILSFLIVWYCLTKQNNQQPYLRQQIVKTDTDRRLNNGETYYNEIQLDKGKICQKCLTQPSEVMRIQLLCQTCDGVLKRGHSHKIREKINRPREQSKKQCLDVIQQEKQLRLQLQSRIQQQNNLKTPSQPQRHSTSKNPTKATTNAESNAIRNLF